MSQLYSWARDEGERIKRCRSKVQPKSHIHALGNVRKCVGMSPHIPKWTPILGIGVPMDSQIFKK